MALLSGVRILDLTWVLAGPYASLLLGDLGAEIIKIESPELGDMTRELGPSLGPLATHFAALNRNKRSVALNLKTEGGRRIFYDLADNPPLSVSGAKAMLARARHASPAIGYDDLDEFVRRARDRGLPGRPAGVPREGNAEVRGAMSPSGQEPA